MVHGCLSEAQGVSAWRKQRKLTRAIKPTRVFLPSFKKEGMIKLLKIIQRQTRSTHNTNRYCCVWSHAFMQGQSCRNNWIVRIRLQGTYADTITSTLQAYFASPESRNIWIILTKELAQNDLSSIVKALLHTVNMHKAISQKRGVSPRGDIFREQFWTEILNVWWVTVGVLLFKALF